jgi:A/G-specific adenine glycosylase
MLEPPLGKWTETFPESAEAIEEAPFIGNWIVKPDIVRHVFTHFVLELVVYTAHFNRRPNGEGRWVPQKELKGAALPTVMRNVIERAGTNAKDVLPG